MPLRIGSKWECDGPDPTGRPYRSRPRDCRTVRVRHPGKPMLPDCPHSRQRQGSAQPEKPLERHYDLPGLDASSSTNRPPLRDARRLRSRNLAQKLREGEANPFVPFGAWRREPGDLPSSRAPSLPGVRPIQGEILPMPARRLSWLYHPVPGTAGFALPQMPVRMVHGLRSFPACAEAGIIS
jgi:hypothetical protein